MVPRYDVAVAVVAAAAAAVVFCFLLLSLLEAGGVCARVNGVAGVVRRWPFFVAHAAHAAPSLLHTIGRIQ